MPLGYNCETVYKAELAHDSIYFVFTNRRKSLLSIMRADIIDDDWTHYGVSNATTAIRHSVTSGAWIIRFPPGGTTAPIEIVFNKKLEKGCVFKPHIYETNMMVPTEDVLKGRQHDTIIEDDIVKGEPTTQEEVERTIDWYEKAKKEVKDKMYLQVFDVILFNKETKQIDFREDMIAETPEEVYLLAVQKFGKYDPKVHVKQANCILGFDEIKEK